MRRAFERFQVLAAVLLDVRVVLNVDWSMGRGQLKCDGTRA